MLIIFLGIGAAFYTAIRLLPPDVSFGDALYLAGASGKLNAVDFSFSLRENYTLWSGLIGGFFLALSYFGCDQSQVQRYLTGKSITHSRISLLFNAWMKVPLQFFILLTGAMVFVFYQFAEPPLLFNKTEAAKMEQADGIQEQYQGVLQDYEQALEHRRDAAYRLIENRRQNGGTPQAPAARELQEANRSVESARQEGISLVEQVNGGQPYNDTNYIFLTFVTRYFPIGMVGLVIAAIFAAAMSTISAELNALATTTMVDLYRRHIRKEAPDLHYVRMAKTATVFWGVYAAVFASFGARLGSLIEAVNRVGSLFYGSLLGVFVLAFGFPQVTGTGAFIGLIAGEVAILLTSWLTEISYLWYNVVGCVVVVVVGLVVSRIVRRSRPA